MPVTPTQAVLGAAMTVAFGYVWYTEGRGRWRSLVEDRFVYGVPWGTILTVAIVVGFYLFAQGGLRAWSDPLILSFVSWSYFYPLGMITAGIAHASPEHLASNVATALVLAPIAEYAWGHYPPGRRNPADSAWDPVGESEFSGRIDPEGGGALTRPWVRALVVFPGALLAVAFLTALFSLGPGLGFSGAVFAMAGFAVVNYPVSTLVAIVASRALSTLYAAITQPVVRATIEPGTPGPPAWAGIGFQAHVLGFLIGVLCGIALWWHRRRRPSAERVFFATLLLGLFTSLWLIAWSSDDVYSLYRGAGVAFVLVLTVLITVAVAGSDRALLRPRSVPVRTPTRRQLAVGWLIVLALFFVMGLAGVVMAGESVGLAVGSLLLITMLLAIPALPSVVPDRWHTGPVSRRQTALVCLAVLTLLVAVPSVPYGLMFVGEDAVPGSGDVSVGDYAVTYEENATGGQTPAIDFGDEEGFASQHTGVIVVSDDRQLWTVGVREEVLEYEGNASVVVGSIGWRETVFAERTGWKVVGNESAYVVDLELDGQTTRSFASDPVQASAVIDDHAIEVVPTDDGFMIRATADGERVGEEVIPPVNQSVGIGDLDVRTEVIDGTERVFVASDGTSVQVAEREEYD